MRIRTTIELGEGVRVEILVTPALYRIAKQRGISLVDDANAGDADPYTSYIKILYCAAINAWEVAAVDDPTMGEFPHKYAEFDEWAWSDKARLGRMINFIYEALTGKTLKDTLKEGVEEVKKKSKR